jgi:transketolase
MVYWTCDFKIPTKKASAFLAAAKRIIKQTYGSEWTISKDVGQRITHLHFWQPAFGYRVDLNTSWEQHKKVEQAYNELMAKAQKQLFELAERMGALISVYLHDGKNKYFPAKQIREAEEAEAKVAGTVSKVIKRIKPEVEKHSELLSIEGVLASAQKRH